MQAAIVPNLQSTAVLQPQEISVQKENSSEHSSFEQMLQKAGEESKKTEEKTESQEKLVHQEVSEKTENQEKSQVSKKSESKQDSKAAEKLPEEKTTHLNREKLITNLDKKDNSVQKSDKKVDSKNKKIESKVSKASKNELPEIKKSENLSEIEFSKFQIDYSMLDSKEIEVNIENLAEIQDKQQELEAVFDLGSLNEGKISNNEKKSFFLDKEKKIAVRDLRTKDAKEEQVSNVQEKKSSLKVTDVKLESKNEAQLTLDLASNVQQNVVSSNDQTASSVTSNFQQMLSNQIQQNASDFVKAGNIVLRDNDQGSIKLILHPESLGNVKIDLQISDKNITGRIVVASQEAFNAFKDSVDSLKQAFINSGFESAGLDLSFAGNDAGSNQFAQEHNENTARFAMRAAYSTLSEDAGFELDEQFIEISSRNSINIVA